MAERRFASQLSGSQKYVPNILLRFFNMKAIECVMGMGFGHKIVDEYASG